MQSACVNWPFMSASSRCCSTLPQSPKSSPLTMNHGRTSGDIFVRAPCRAQTPCRTGRDLSAIPASLRTAVLRRPIGSAAVNNPLRILQTLDHHLTRPAEITLFGRAALALGYEDSPPEFAGSHDVDAILPLPWLAAEDENMDFWQAQVKTNAELQQEGLYITHLFRELEIILTPDWLNRRVRVSLELIRQTPPLHRAGGFQAEHRSAVRKPQRMQGSQRRELE